MGYLPGTIRPEVHALADARSLFSCTNFMTKLTTPANLRAKAITTKVAQDGGYTTWRNHNLRPLLEAESQAVGNHEGIRTSQPSI